MVNGSDSSRWELSDLLQTAIKKSNINRQFLADKLECSVDTIDNWCSGRARIGSNHINALCAILNDLHISADIIHRIYVKNLECYGFVPTWSPGNITERDVTLCILGSLTYRKELSILQRISDHFTYLKRTTLIVHCGDRVDSFLSCVDLAISIGASNIILCGMSMPEDVYRLVMEKIKLISSLVVFLLTNSPSSVINDYPNAYEVNWSPFRLAQRATDILISSGHKSIATIYLEKHAARFSGYLQALKEANISPRTDLVLDGCMLSDYSGISNPRYMSQLERFLLNRNGDMTAIFSPTELLSFTIPVMLKKNNDNSHSQDVAISGLAYPGWVGQELGLSLTYLEYPINAATEAVLDILLRKCVANIDSDSARHIDLTDKAVRIDLNGSNLKKFD